MTGKRKMGDFSSAQEIGGLIRKIVREEMNRQRPRPRYATVESIDRERRSCMVRYVGESESVRVPYNGTGPANVGQEVRIDGPPSDRVIVDVRGTSDSEARVHEVEVGLGRRSPASGRWSLASNWDMPYNSWGVIPISRWEVPGGYPPFGGIEATPGGEITIPADGYYEVGAKAVISGPFGEERREVGLWIQPPGQGAQYASEMTSEGIIGTGQYGVPYNIKMRLVTLSTSDLLYLAEGTKVTIRGRSASGPSGGNTVYGSSERTITGVWVSAVLLGPQEEDVEDGG